MGSTRIVDADELDLQLPLSLFQFLNGRRLMVHVAVPGDLPQHILGHGVRAYRGSTTDTSWVRGARMEAMALLGPLPKVHIDLPRSQSVLVDAPEVALFVFLA